MNAPQKNRSTPTVPVLLYYSKHSPPTVNWAPPTVNSAHPTDNTAPPPVNSAPAVNSAPSTVSSAHPTVNAAPPTIKKEQHRSVIDQNMKKKIGLAK